MTDFEQEDLFLAWVLKSLGLAPDVISHLWRFKMKPAMTKCYLLEEASSAIEMDESWESEIGQQLIKHPATVKIYESEEPVDNNLVI